MKKYRVTWFDSGLFRNQEQERIFTRLDDAKWFVRYMAVIKRTHAFLEEVVATAAPINDENI